MNWFLMLLSAVAGGVATWLWSVRKVRRQIPVYEPTPAATTDRVTAPDTTAAVVGDDSSAASDADVSTGVGSVPAAAPLVGEQGMLSGLEGDAPETGTSDADAAVAPSSKRKPRTKKKAAAPVAEAETEVVVDVAPAAMDTLLDDPADPHLGASVPDGPHGPGSAAAGEDGSGPAGWTIKGNANSGLYHAPGSPWYGRTIAEAWFQTEQAAEAAGFTRWDRRTKK